MSVQYRQTISRPGRPEGFDAAIRRAEAALITVLADAAAGKLHALTIAEEASDLAPAHDRARRIRETAEHVVVLGVGGSSLGAQMLAQITGFATPMAALPVSGPRLHVLDNLDASSMAALLDGLPLARTHFIAVSKSGTTAETMMQLLAVLARLKERGLAARIPALITVITEPKESPLTRLAGSYGLAALPHPLDIGGRFSVLSIVGLLPALVLDLDAAAVRAGAAEVLSQAKSHASSAVTDGAAFAFAAAEAGRLVSVLMPYTDRLERFAMWYRQLWAESLGKDGRGSFPVRALGPVDQHSQLQLYLAGPPKAAFTVLTLDETGAGPRVPAAFSGDKSLAYLEGKAIGDLVMAEARATLETFEAHQQPCRRIEVARIDERSLGALAMHFMLETIIAAQLFGVDAFDQPAVEEGKIRARRALEAMK